MHDRMRHRVFDAEVPRNIADSLASELPTDDLFTDGARVIVRVSVAGAHIDDVVPLAALEEVRWPYAPRGVT
jgi:hypothetical protein